jgi:L-iditol 2-dehydrogenase
VKALVHTAPLRLEYTDRPDPVAGPGDVLVRVEAVAICGSDVHGYTGTTGRRIPPVIMGHEAAGVVAASGPGAEVWVPGTRVTFDSIVWCGDCPPCLAGRTNLCVIRQTFGVSTPAFRRDGAMADYVVVPARLLHRLPDDVSFDAGAMVEPAAVAMHAARISRIVQGDLVVVVGAGLIGNLAMQAGRTLGAGAVAIVDIVPERLELARQLGADIVIDSSRGDPATVLERATGRRTADIVLEAVGIQATIDLATALSRPGGSLTLIGNVRPRIEQDLQGIVSGELTVRGSSASAGEYPDCIERIADGRLRVTELISRTQPLESGPAAFEALHRGEPGLMRIVLHPSGR